MGMVKRLQIFLVDLYNNGLNANSNYNFTINVNHTNLTINQFKHLVYWLILQEDINYPRPRFKGIKLPLTRYIEGAIAAIHPELLPLKQVMSRTNNHGGGVLQDFKHPNLTPYLVHNLNKLQ